METIDIFISKDGTISMGCFADMGVVIFSTRLCFTRLRDSVGQERLGVEIFENCETEAYAKTYMSNLDFQRNIIKLREFGVLIPRKEIRPIIKYLEENYRSMAVVADTGTQTLEVDLPKIVQYICGYIFQQGIPAETIGNKELYNIGVTTFSDILKASPFAFYPLKTIKQTLYNEGFTERKGDRLDNTIRRAGKTVKVISFYSGKLNSTLDYANIAIVQ